MLGADANKLKTQSLAVKIVMVTGLVVKRSVIMFFKSFTWLFGFTFSSFQNFMEIVNFTFMGGTLYSLVRLYITKFPDRDEESRQPNVIMTLSSFEPSLNSLVTFISLNCLT